MKLQTKIKHIIISLGTAFLLLVGLFLLVGVASIHPALAQGSIIFVDVDALGPTYDGLSWTTAFTNVQDALNAAISGDEIWVAEGVYYPDEGAGQINNVPTSTFILTSGVTLYGGFAATETLRTERNWETHVTVLSGDLDGNDTIDANGIVIKTGDITGTNAYHVVTADSVVTESVVLDGFTITAGSAADADPDQHGAGLYNNGGSPTLANLIFSANLASSDNGLGGGLYNNGGSLALSNITFNKNQAAERGGGMYNEGGNSTLINVTFNDNDAVYGGGVYNNSSASTLITVTFSNNSTVYEGTSGSGGGMNNTDSDLTLTNVTFSNNEGHIGAGMYNYNSQAILSNITFNNQSAYWAGGMYNYSSTLTLTDATFTKNKAGWAGGMFNVGCQRHLTFTNVVFTRNRALYGGGMNNSDSHPTLTNVIFRKNKAYITGGYTDAGLGGGIYNTGSDPTLINVTFSGNIADNQGGGIFNDNSDPILTNVTFSGNTADNQGGGIFNYSNNNPSIYNSILWNNTPDQISDNSNSTTTVAYSLVQGAAVYTGTGNINSDPLFVDADGPDDVAGTDDDDLRLQAASPAIDAGDNDALPADTLDLDNDGDSTEKIPVDLDGNPRFIDTAVADAGNGTAPIVDMGAYEEQQSSDSAIYLPVVMK